MKTETSDLTFSRGPSLISSLGCKCQCEKLGGSDHYPTFHLKSRSLEESSRMQRHFGHLCSLPPPDALSFLSSLLWVCTYPSVKRSDWLKKTKQILTAAPQLLQSSRSFVQQRPECDWIIRPSRQAEGVDAQVVFFYNTHNRFK